MNKKNLYQEEESDNYEEENEGSEEEIEVEELEIVDELEDSKAFNLDEVVNNNNEDQREQIETTSSKNLENRIKDKLDFLDLDLQSMPKDELIHRLLETEEDKKNKKKNKFPNIPRNHSPNRGNALDIYKNTRIMSENKDPELSQDFNVALTKILSKMVNNNNGEIFDILLSDRAKIEQELNKYNFTKSNNNKMDEKIKNWIDQKNKNLSIIQERLNDEFNKQCTFTPQLYGMDNKPKRNFEQFLEDQINHMKKFEEKISFMQEQSLKDKVSTLTNVPKINETSKRLAEMKLKSEDKENNKQVYDRLYSQRVNKSKEISCNSPSKIDSKSNNAKLKERTKILYEDAIKRQLKQKEACTIKESNEIKSSDNSNKFIFKKFQSLYRNEVENLLNKLASRNEMNENNKLNFAQLEHLLGKLCFVSGENIITAQSSHERKLLIELYENIKDHEGLINLDHLFLFCLSVLNLLEYYIIKSYKQNENEDEVNHTIAKNKSQKSLMTSQSDRRIMTRNNTRLNVNDEATSNLINKLNLELSSRITDHKKYGGFDSEGNFIITFTHSKLIFKDFHTFTSNWNNFLKISKKKKRDEELTGKTDQLSFKPLINKNSLKMCNNYKNRVMEQIEDGLENEFQMCKSDLDHLQIAAMKKIKQEKINERIREERLQKELEKCTFKPRINEYQTTKENVELKDNSKRGLRFEQMYNKGKEILINKKDKTKEELEVEKYGKECTFKPRITEANFIGIFEKNLSQNDNDLVKFSERMKRGRMEKEYKENFLKRGEYPLTRNKSENSHRIVSIRNEVRSPLKSYMNNGLDKIFSSIDDNDQDKNKVKGEVPKLIIDVNIKPGEKKKIYVNEGDSAESLAIKFTKENNLDNATRIKLQKLIQEQMTKLLK